MNIYLVKTKFVVNRQKRNPNANDYDSEFFITEFDPDDEGYFRGLTIDTQVFKDLGSPETLTITLEPGDVLNG